MTNGKASIVGKQEEFAIAILGDETRYIRIVSSSSVIAERPDGRGGVTGDIPARTRLGFRVAPTTASNAIYPRNDKQRAIGKPDLVIQSLLHYQPDLTRFTLDRIRDWRQTQYGVRRLGERFSLVQFNSCGRKAAPSRRTPNSASGLNLPLRLRLHHSVLE
jgi:hypothetical protein